MTVDYLPITELSGDEVTQEQIDRLCNRYYWAGTYCSNKDVLEVACGTGQGLGYLSSLAKSICAGDYSSEILKIARTNYGNRISLLQLDAQNLPFPDNSKDIIILFEAIYYLPSAEKFVNECRRVLRKGGMVLIATANKDLYDFNPSPHSFKYYGVIELNELFDRAGFSIQCFGNTPIMNLSWRQRLFRPVKRIAVQLDLIPRTSHGKKLFKRLVFGNLLKLPSEVKVNMVPYLVPRKLSLDYPDREHKVIYCLATLHK